MKETDPRDPIAATSGKPPADVYAGELKRLAGLQSSELRRERTLGYSKLLIAAATLAATVLLHRNTMALACLVAPVVLFIVLAVRQEKLLASIRYRGRAISFYERGLARLNDRWAGNGETGERFLDPAHPYARDLDLFGRASLFEYLCTARTHAGEETLARWLLAMADPEEITTRQKAVSELEARVKFRERLHSAGETVRLGVHPEALSAWGESNAIFDRKGIRILALVLAVLWILSLAAWALWDLPELAALMTVLNFAYAHRIHARLERAAGALENAAQDLRLLAEVLAVLEQEQVSSPRLQNIQAALRRNDMAPSGAIRKLWRVVDLLKSRHSLFIRELDLVTFWSLQLVFVAEGWKQKFGPAIRGWLTAVGEFEALASFSSFAYEHPRFTFPEFVSAGPLLDACALAHPLLPADKVVENDVELDKEMQLVILSGPNMAGKSTFLRSIGVNAVLAQCGAPVCAQSLRMSPLRVTASICILDSLAGGVSRFYAEIHRLKLIADLAEGPVPVLFLFDELLSGTNSHDRFAGAQFVLQHLIEHGAIGIVSTHDLALTGIPDLFDGKAANYHFEDRLEDGRLVFDYKLKTGVVQTSNALKLMRAVGLGVTE